MPGVRGRKEDCVNGQRKEARMESGPNALDMYELRRAVPERQRQWSCEIEPSGKAL